MKSLIQNDFTILDRFCDIIKKANNENHLYFGIASGYIWALVDTKTCSPDEAEVFFQIINKMEVVTPFDIGALYEKKAREKRKREKNEQTPTNSN